MEFIGEYWWLWLAGFLLAWASVGLLLRPRDTPLKMFIFMVPVVLFGGIFMLSVLVNLVG